MSYNQGYGNQQMKSGGAYNDPTIQTAPNTGFEQAYGTGNDVYDSGNPGGGAGAYGTTQQSGTGYDSGNAVNTGQNVGGYDTTQSAGGGYNDTSGYNNMGYDTTQASGGGFNDDTAGGYGGTRTGYDTTQSSGGGYNDDNIGGYGGSTQQQGYGGGAAAPQQQGFDTTGGNAQQQGFGQQQGYGQPQQQQQQSFDPSQQTSDYGQQPQQAVGSQHRPSAGEKIKGGLEKLAGKLTGNPAKAAHGDDVAHGRNISFFFDTTITSSDLKVTMSDEDATLPYSIDDDVHSSFGEQHESPETRNVVEDDQDDSREESGPIDNEQPKGLGDPQYSSRSLNSTGSDLSKSHDDQSQPILLAMRDQLAAYPYGQHLATRPKNQSNGSSNLSFGFEYPEVHAAVNVMKSNHGVVSRMAIDDPPMPIEEIPGVRREDIDRFKKKDGDARAPEELMEGSDFRRRERHKAEQYKNEHSQMKKYNTDPVYKPYPVPEEDSMMMEPPAKRRRYSHGTMEGDFGLGPGSSLGRALKEIEQPPKMRRYNTQSTIVIESLESESIEPVLSSDLSGQHSSSFEKQPSIDDDDDDDYGQRLRQASPARSEAPDVAAENDKIDLQYLSSLEPIEPAIEDQHANQEDDAEDAQQENQDEGTQQENQDEGTQQVKQDEDAKGDQQAQQDEDAKGDQQAQQDEDAKDDQQAKQDEDGKDDQHAQQDEGAKDAQQAKQGELAEDAVSAPAPSSSQQKSSNKKRSKSTSRSSTTKPQPIAERLRRRNPPQNRISVTYSSTVKEDDIFNQWKKLTKSSIYPTISEADTSDWHQCNVMVFKVDPSTNKPAPTAKYIYARLADKPIISMEWLHASVEADMIQEYAKFRISEEPVQNHPLKGKSIYFAIQRLNEEDALYKKTYQRPLVNVLHGKLLRKEPQEPDANTVVIVDAGSDSAAKFKERGIATMTRDELRASVQ
ncbi:hypothetical protein O0I10_011847 [Lichtheimia ornata]|uniref:BRCT domain-containing protein n=1 Tax=Lichtheimia ornata TaxID=688661 RepID=A0AAD7XTP7_9FUNG|nr:uncharacterized protein O0I10_011847 [Lichtheimia ornata]KAJ8652523.1 hypothetical protein O0I10_011847 [Lichtheimia ornata]